MTRKDLAKEIAKKTNLKFDVAEKLVLAFGDTISEALTRGDKIVYSNFGTFYTVHYPSKVIHHPKLGAAKKIIMLPTNVTKWMPSDNIKKMVNSGTTSESPTIHGKKKGVEAIQAPVADPIPAAQTILSPPANQDTNTEINQPTNDTKQETGKSVNIYEELMTDGSKVESTFGDAIRLPRSFIGRMFNRQKDPAVTTQEKNTSGEKVSLVGSGIFESNADKPPIPNTPPINPGTAWANEGINNNTGYEKNNLEVNAPNLCQPPIAPSPAQYEAPGNDLSSPPNSATPAAAPNNISAPLVNDIKVTNEPEAEPDLVPFPIAKNTSLSYIDLSKTIVPKEILQKIPERIARKYKMVPVNEDNGSMIVAMIDPEDIEAREIIKKYIQEAITIKLTTEDDINHVLDQYSALESDLESALENAEEVDGKGEDEKKALLLESASDNAPAARIVTSLLKRAIREKASDIHVEPAEKEMEIRFRLDGILKKTASLPKDIQAAVISRIKILSNLKIDEQRMPQDGRFSLTVDNRRVDFRISTMPVAYGEKVVMRVLDKVSGILTIEQLGIRGTGLELLKESIEKSHGMTLVTGPTGSGKTTTLYALIEKIYNESINIITLEDPIEYRMPGINQSQVNAEIDYTFASGLRSIVRQDPDVIMIGEIRDPETAEMAVHAALTGHIVLSTLHTNDASGAAPRIMDMGVEPFLLTSSLNCVIAQRLARKICDDCKEEIKPAETQLTEIKEVLDKLPPREKEALANKEIKLWKGKGCKNCANTGYKGRLGIYEVLNISEEIKEMILQKQSAYKIEEKAVEQGMVKMIQDGVLKVIDGITSLEEVWRVIKE